MALHETVRAGMAPAVSAEHDVHSHSHLRNFFFERAAATRRGREHAARLVLQPGSLRRAHCRAHARARRRIHHLESERHLIVRRDLQPGLALPSGQSGRRAVRASDGHGASRIGGGGAWRARRRMHAHDAWKQPVAFNDRVREGDERRFAALRARRRVDADRARRAELGPARARALADRRVLPDLPVQRGGRCGQDVPQDLHRVEPHAERTGELARCRAADVPTEPARRSGGLRHLLVVQRRRARPRRRRHAAARVHAGHLRRSARRQHHARAQRRRAASRGRRWGRRCSRRGPTRGTMQRFRVPHVP